MNDTLITLSPIIEPIVQLVVLVIVGVAVRLLSHWTGVQVEAKHREALQSALMNGAYYAIARYGSTTDGVKDLALDYVKKSVPDAIHKFDLSDADLERMVLPKIQEAVQ